MKKILLTLLLVLPWCMAIKAQDFRWGITGGYNLSSPTAYQSQSGFHAGVKGELRLLQVTKGLYLDFGITLSSHGWESPGYHYNESYQSSYSTKRNQGNTIAGYSLKWNCTPYYLNIPVHVGYKFSTGRSVSLFVNAGPYFNIGLFGKAKETVTSDNGKTITYTRASNIFSEKMMERFDWGLGFCAGIEIIHHIQLAIGYDWGMKNINKNGIIDCKNRTFTVSCAYMF